MSTRFHREQSEHTKKLLSPDTPVHPDDKGLVDNGVLSAREAKLRRQMQERNFANEFTDGDDVRGRRLSTCVRMAYAPPSLTTVPLTLLISVYVIQFYEQLGAALGLLAFFQALARGFDVITDPTMSYLTDSCRSKHGRRRPFLFTGAPVYAFMLVFLLFPQPTLNKVEVSTWFGFFYILFFLTATYCNIPYDALAPELTDTDEDRNNLFFTCTMFDGLGAIFAACLPIGFTKLVGWNRATNKQRYESCNLPTAAGIIDALSDDGPWLTSRTGRSTAPPSVRSWSGQLQNLTEYWGSDMSLADTFVPADCAKFGSVIPNCGTNSSTDFACWCECRVKSDVFHNLDSLRYAYFWTGLAFGLWAWVSLWVCVKFVKERSQIAAQAGGHPAPMPKPAPLVPSILNTLNNKPFTLLLPAFVLDSLANAIISSLLTFFIRYIVQPEYSNEEKYGCKPQGGSEDWHCSSSTVLGACVMALLIGAVVFTPVWKIAASKLGKRNAWLLWSLTNGITFLCYVPVGKGQIELCIIMSVLNGAPMGGKFLADSIMADVIDYDEFLTGARSEATYTMFKGFLPKIAAIPASAVPIALLSTFGHVAPLDGVLQPQPASIRQYIRIVIIYIPSMLAFGAFILKMKFPLTSPEHVNRIKVGIATHIASEPAMDPCSGKMYQPVHFEPGEMESKEMLDHFPEAHIIEKFMKDPASAAAHTVKVAKLQVCGAVLWLVVFLSISALTFGLLLSEDKAAQDLQFIPVLAIVGFGAGITLLGFTFLRYKGAKALLGHLPDKHTLKKLLRQRQDLSDVKNFDCSIKHGCSRNPTMAKSTTNFEEASIKEMELNKVYSPDSEIVTGDSDKPTATKDPVATVAAVAKES